jgi:membrane-bound lytic murein transglycosylase A
MNGTAGGIRATLILALMGWFAAGCAGVFSPPAGIGRPIAWSQLPGWSSAEARPAEAWPALKLNCRAMAGRDARWREICAEVALLPAEPDDELARAFFETRFVPHEVRNEAGGLDGLITGYYEPLLLGNLTKTDRFRYPVYGLPPDLLVVDLGELYPELAGKRVRGRLEGRRVVPYFSRAEIEQGRLATSAPVLAWVDDPVALFFLHIQGSGRIRLLDGRILRVGYADQNGHPYVSIGRRLIEMGALAPEKVDLDAIRAWLAAHPEQAEAVLHSNPSYVFFTLRPDDLPGPLGSLGVPLLPQRAIAVDPAYVPLGSPVWLDTRLPGEERPYQRLVFAQDTGGAIKGAVRADLFFGFGPEAERLAGRMKQSGRLYVLLPAARGSD